MRGFIVFLSICLGVLVIPDGFFSHDGLFDRTVADYQPSKSIAVIDMSIFEQEDTIFLDETSITETQKTLPLSVFIDAPFYPQAPNGKRTLPWSMLCSEANLVLAAYAIKGKPLSKEQFIKDMRAMIPLQEKAFGTYFSIPMHDLKSVYDTMYPGIGRTRIVNNPTIEDIKGELSQGNLIIAPTAGRKLGNPFFINGGPRFHTILIVGYDEKYFYVNEVGMSNGRNFAYSHETVMYAMHDFVKDDDISQGAKLIMIVARD